MLSNKLISERHLTYVDEHSLSLLKLKRGGLIEVRSKQGKISTAYCAPRSLSLKGISRSEEKRTQLITANNKIIISNEEVLEGFIIMGDVIRREIKVRIGEIVSVKEAKIREADEIILEPLSKENDLGFISRKEVGSLRRAILQKYKNFLIGINDVIHCDYAGMTKIPFKITAIEPSSNDKKPIKVTSKTIFKIKGDRLILPLNIAEDEQRDTVQS